jgi:hypothetical protein
MSPFQKHTQEVNRRSFLRNSLSSIGLLALGDLLGSEASDKDLLPKMSLGMHHRAKVKRVIHLCMAGGPSHLETFDYKPELEKNHGLAMPDSFTAGAQIAQLQGKELTVKGPTFGFGRHGKSGMMVSERFPQIATVADDIAVIRSMYTEQINHDPAHTFMNTGSIIPGRPSMGAWTLYGLGSLSSDLPGYVVLTSEGGGQGQPISARQWHNGFLPSKHQGVAFHSKGDPVHYVSNPHGISRESQGDLIETINGLNAHLASQRHDPEIATRIAQYELAYQMQSSVPELADFSKEPQSALDLYGATPGDGSFASNCLMARRLAERGVRFIQLYHRGWDHHNNLKENFTTASDLVDQATAGLIKDLKMRGMLDDTLIIWGGEFGRTPMSQGGAGDGRDHHIAGFSIFLAGGGIKGGTTHGATDEFGYNAEVDRTSVHDLHATMLHLLGIDHKRLTYKFQGRDFRLTDVHGHLINGVLA